MRFRVLLLIGVAIEIVLVLVICASAVVAIDANRSANRQTAEAIDDLVATQDFKNHVNRMSVAAREYLITGDERFVARVRESQRGFASASDSFDTNRDHGAARDHLLARLNAYSHAIDAAVQNRSSITDLAAVQTLFEEQLTPHRRAVEDVLGVVVQQSRANTVEAAAWSERVADTARTVITIGAITAILLAVVLGAVVARKLARQFRAIQRSEQAATDAAAARRELLDIVSHDLRAPLTTIVLGLETLREQHGELRQVQRVDRAAKRMQRLVDDLLDSARAQTHGLPLQVERVGCHELLQQALEAFSEPAERAGIKLDIEHSLNALVQVDRDRVLQILSNLLVNALNVTPRGGTITLAAHPTDTGVRFSVHDSGPGIEAEKVPLLFEAYRQGGSARSGLGLGLYISKTLTQAHGGTIGVDSEPTCGSTFWFEIPRAITADRSRG